MSFTRKTTSRNPTANLYFSVAPGVWGTKDVFVNMYFIEAKDGWVLVDAGLKTSHHRIKKIAAELFGEGNPPLCILLTHGHFDHTASLQQLIADWGVPVYAHPLEAPYLTGMSAYPPPDPSVGGGIMPAFSVLFPRKPIDISDSLRHLPPDGEVPSLPGWRWLHTPGHAPGHVSFFREEDRTLISGDAVVTTRQESAMSIARQTPVLSGPPRYFTIDWDAAESSVRAIADLEPEVIASGHGRPLRGSFMRDALHTLADNFRRLAVPEHGRYVDHPALADEGGVFYIPERERKAERVALMVVGVALVVGVLTYALAKRRKRFA